MTQIATNLEQSKKLIELGIDVNTSDMYWEYDSFQGFHRLELFEDGFPKNLNKDDIPAWSLPALIELMPDHIVINDKVSNSLKMDKEESGVGFCYFFSAFDKVDDIIMCDMTLIDAAFKMVCYLLENKLI